MADPSTLPGSAPPVPMVVDGQATGDVPMPSATAEPNLTKPENETENATETLYIQNLNEKIRIPGA